MSKPTCSTGLMYGIPMIHCGNVFIGGIINSSSCKGFTVSVDIRPGMNVHPVISLA